MPSPSSNRAVAFESMCGVTLFKVGAFHGVKAASESSETAGPAPPRADAFRPRLIVRGFEPPSRVQTDVGAAS
jgi:hypothetical protein